MRATDGSGIDFIANRPIVALSGCTKVDFECIIFILHNIMILSNIA